MQPPRFRSVPLLAILLAVSCVVPPPAPRTAAAPVLDRDPYARPALAGSEDRTASTPQPRPAEGMEVSALAFPTGDPATSLILCERHTPTQVLAGEPFEYTLEIVNLTAHPLRDVRLVERLPDTATVHRAEPVPAALAAGRLSWFFPELGPRERRRVEVRLTQNDAGELTHRAAVTCEPELVSRTSARPPALRVHLSAPTEVLRCEPLPVRLTVTNTGELRTRGTRLELPLPAGLVLGGPVRAEVERAEGERAAVLEVPPLGRGQSHTARVELACLRTGTFTLRSAAVGGARSDLVAVTVHGAVLAAELDGNGPVSLGGQVPLRIVVRNEGDGVAPGTVVRLALPEGTPLLSGSPGVRVVGDGLLWELGDLRPDEERELQADLAALAPGTLAARLSVRSACAEPVERDVEVPVLVGSDLLFDLVAADGPVRAGTEHAYVLRVANHGERPVGPVRIDARLSGDGVLVDTSGPPEARPGESARSVVLELGELLRPGDEARWEILVRGVAAGSGELRAELRLAGRPLVDRRARTEYHD